MSDVEPFGAVFGYAYIHIYASNWMECWALKYPSDNDPFVIRLADGTLWVVPHHMPDGTWGHHVRPDTAQFLGPFDTLDEAIITFSLLVTR